MSFNQRLREWLPLICVFIAGLLSLLPAALNGVPVGPDLPHHYRFAVSFVSGLESGVAYPGWLAESNNGYGDPSFRFYPPGVYYLMAVPKLLGADWYTASLITFAALSIISGLGTYYWARLYFPAQYAAIAGVLFIFPPYHMDEIYQAFLLAEFSSAAVMPFTFAFVERVCRTGSKSDIAGLAFSFLLLTLFHLPLTLIGSIALTIYGLVRMEKGRYVVTIIKLAAGSLIGLAAGAPFWLIMISETSLIRTEVLLDYQKNFIFSTFSGDNLNIWFMNIIAVITFMMVVPAFIRLRALINEVGPKRVWPIIILFIFTFLMSTLITYPLWYIVKPLQMVQFPWRWFQLVSLIASILSAGGLMILFREKIWQKDRALALLIFLLPSCSILFSATQIMRDVGYYDRASFQQLIDKTPGSPSINYWHPRWVKVPFKKMDTPIEIEERNYNIISWQANKRVFSVTAGKPATARVRTFYYPHWQATAEGKLLPITPSSDGAILISLPEQAVNVELAFVEPRLTQLARVLALIGLVTIILLIISDYVSKSKLKTESSQ